MSEDSGGKEEKKMKGDNGKGPSANFVRKM